MARWLRPTDGYAPLHPAGTTRCTALASEASRSFNWSHLARRAALRARNRKVGKHVVTPCKAKNKPSTILPLTGFKNQTQVVGLLAHLVNVG